MFRVAGFDYMNVLDTDNIALGVFFQGCNHHCNGCHNKELQDIAGGELYSKENLYNHIVTNCDKESGFNTVLLSGGDPLFQDKTDLLWLVVELAFNGYDVWMYTGYDYSEVPQLLKDFCYCIKCGKYDTRFPKKPNSKLATGNQAYYYRDGVIKY